MQGVLAMAGCEDKYVYQGVHMLFTGETLGPWGEEERVNRLVFIGKNLVRAERPHRSAAVNDTGTRQLAQLPYNFPHSCCTAVTRLSWHDWCGTVVARSLHDGHLPAGA